MNKQNIDFKKIETLLNRELNKRYLDPEFHIKDVGLELECFNLLNIKDEEDMAKYIYGRFFTNRVKVFDAVVSKFGTYIIVRYKEGV